MTKQLISIHKICETYQVPATFFEQIQMFELLPVQNLDEQPAIDADLLPDLERIMRLHFDLNVNMEGIDVINNLMHQIEQLQDEIKLLKEKLQLYE